MSVSEFCRCFQSVGMESITTHPNFDPDNAYKGWDIAVLKLTEDAWQQPVSLPATGSWPTETVYALGWGQTSQYLQILDIQVSSTETCKATFPGHGPHIFCAKNKAGNSCHGKHNCNTHFHP